VAITAPERVARLVLVGAGTAGRRIEGILECQLAVASLQDPVPMQASTVCQPLPAAEASFQLRDARMPTPLLWGNRDAIFTRAEQEALLALLPNAAPKVYPQTGHALHWETARGLRA
jgi:pimeloyl-ACP methyl ester carboxylesterase